MKPTDLFEQLRLHILADTDLSPEGKNFMLSLLKQMVNGYGVLPIKSVPLPFRPAPKSDVKGGKPQPKR